MEKYVVLFNKDAANKRGQEAADKLKEILKDAEIEFKDMHEYTDYKALFDTFSDEDKLVIVGGDGTLNRFINDSEGLYLTRPVYYYPGGNGNDFYTDISNGGEPALVEITKYLKNLPEVTVKGKTYKFLNGIGYGIDGYCCEEGDKRKAKSDKPVNYTSIAISGLLFHYKPTKATVTVDGVTKVFEKAWLAPTMNGRYYGGGMKVTPDQDRLHNETLSVALMYGSGKLKTLMVFPKIFTGEHIKHTEMTAVLTGKEINVKFDRPVAAQIDGETVLEVSEYTAKAPEIKD